MRTLLAAIFLIPAAASAEDKFIGWQSCATSGCHGGGTGKDQVKMRYTPQGGQMLAEDHIHLAHPWGSKLDLSKLGETAEDGRYAAMAAALKKFGIEDGTKSRQCTVCHAPMKAVPAERLTFKTVPNTVTCETCHGPAEKWRLTHARKDVTHEQRVAMGMRDLSTPYLRANSCVGCHANVSGALVDSEVRHPDIRFEFARQIASLPPHWDGDEQPARNWLTGQAVLLRELCWQEEKKLAPKSARERISALHWLLRETELGAKTLPEFRPDAATATLRPAADKLARAASGGNWSKEQTRQLFKQAATLASALEAAEQPDRLQRAQLVGRMAIAMVYGLEPKPPEKLRVLLENFDFELYQLPRHRDAAFALKNVVARIAELDKELAAKP